MVKELKVAALDVILGFIKYKVFRWMGIQLHETIMYKQINRPKNEGLMGFSTNMEYAVI